MCWLLKKCSYEINNVNGDNNKFACNVDIILMLIYSIVSIYSNAKILIPASVLEFFNIPQPVSVPVIQILLINLTVLIRLNVGLYVKKKENIQKILMELESQREVASEILINTWNIRMWIVTIGYIIDLVIGIGFIFYRDTIEKALVFIAIITVLETFFNNFLDDLVVRYEATPKIFKSL